MSDASENNGKRIANVAPLRNVMLMGAMIQQLIDRTRDLPGIGCFHGFSGSSRGC